MDIISGGETRQESSHSSTRKHYLLGIGFIFDLPVKNVLILPASNNLTSRITVTSTYNRMHTSQQKN